MNYSSIEGEGFSIPLPITQLARDISLQFAKEQPNSVKADRVLLNTLAVLAVKDYLKMMGISTSLDNSDSWNRVMRLCADVADLEIPNLGILECRSVRSNQQSCYIPAEVWQDRIGYLVIEIADDLQEAKILGFVQQVEEEELAISQLKSPEDFLDHLAELRSSERSRIILSQWLDGIFDRYWQDLKSFSGLFETNLEWAFRGFDPLILPPIDRGNRKAKLLVLERELLKDSLLLIVSVRDDSSENIGSSNRGIHISLQLHSVNQIYLPENVHLRVLDRLNDVFLSAESRERDNYLQLDLQGDLGEFFSVEVTLGNCEVREDFVV